MSLHEPEMIESPKKRAFTLAETIGALVVLSIAMPPMLWAMRDAQVKQVNTVMASHAMWLAREKLDDIAADRHSLSRGYKYLNTRNYPAELPIANDPAYTRTVSFNETRADLVKPGKGFMTASVTVAWTDATDEDRSVRVRTVLTDYKP